MVYRSVGPQPPRGSTEWGARQFYRLLDDEERVAAERERLLAMGWRPPRGAASTQPFSQEPVFGDERDAYADLMHQDVRLRRAVDEEARRRVAAQLGRSVDTTPGWAGGGRFGVPIPPEPTAGPGVPESGAARYTPTGASDIGKIVAWALGALGAAEIGREATDREDGAENPFDFGWSEREMAPPDAQLPPRTPDGRGPKAIVPPQPGFPGVPPNLGQTNKPAVPVPLPPDLTKDIPRPDAVPEEFKKHIIPGSLPAILDKFWQAGILESRTERPETRQDNEDIINWAKEQMEECGWAAEHTHGASKIERHFPPLSGRGMKDSRRTDGTVKGTSPDGRKAIFDFNTAKRLARPSTWNWVAYERRAAAAIRQLKDAVDRADARRFEVYPKSLGMDREVWREEVRPFVKAAVRALLDC